MVYERYHNGFGKLVVFKQPAGDDYELEQYILKHKIVDNQIHLIFGRTGSGKSILTERMVEEFYKLGITIIVMTVKPDSEYDFGYCMFKPDDPEHLSILNQQGEEPSEMPTKFYHPLSLHFGKKDEDDTRINKIIEHTFYSYPIKSISENALKALFVSESDAIAIATTQKLIKRLKDSDGVINFLWDCYKELNKNEDEDIFELMEDMNNIPMKSMGSNPTLKLIQNSFALFNESPFLQNKYSQYNLDMEKIINDNKHIHIFVNGWIPEQLRYFELICRIDAIQKVLKQEKNKRQICLVFEEIGTLLRSANKSKAEEELNLKIAKFLATKRSKGVTTVANTQDYFEASSSFRKKATQKYVMKCSEDDRARLAKEFPKELNSDNSSNIPTFRSGQFYWFENLKNGVIYRSKLPTFAHVNEGQHFTETVKRKRPDLLRDYNNFLKELKQTREQELETQKLISEEYINKINNKKEEKNENVIQKQAESLKELELRRKAMKDNRKMLKQDIMKRCYELKITDEHPSWREIAKQIKAEYSGATTTEKTAKNLALKYAELVGDVAFGVEYLNEK